MDAQTRLTAILDEYVTEEVKASSFLGQVVTDAIEHVIEEYDLEDPDLIGQLIYSTDKYFN